MKRFALKRLLFVLLVSGGTLVQVSCTQVAAETLGGISSAIANAYLRSAISDWLEIGTGLPFGLGT